MVREGGVRLPTTLRAAYRSELFRAFHSPYETPIVVAVNGALMAVLWFLVPAQALFSVHATWAFPLVLAGWMYSDVPATNVLGSDARRVLAAIDKPETLRLMLYAKNLVLMTLVVPIATTVAIVVAFNMHRTSVLIWNIAWIVLVPLGALGVSSWFGVYFPYHPIPIKDRWENRKPFFHKIVRWLTLAMVPYGLVPMLSFLIVAPTLLVWRATGVIVGSPQQVWNGTAPVDPSHSGHDLGYAIGTLVGCTIAIVLWFFGHRFAIHLVNRRREKLVAYLSDPSLG